MTYRSIASEILATPTNSTLAVFFFPWFFLVFFQKIGDRQRKSETEKRSVAPLFVEEKRKKTHKISRFWVLLLLLRVLKAKVEQFHENSINFESEC
jgi:hypothetical protein